MSYCKNSNFVIKYIHSRIRAAAKIKLQEVKMRVDEIIAICDAIKTNEISEDLKLYWLNEVEGRVHCEINKSPIEGFSKLTTMAQELSIPMPYAKIYLSYMLAMIAFATKEYDLYADITNRYERELYEYAKYCLKAR